MLVLVADQAAEWYKSECSFLLESFLNFDTEMCLSFKDTDYQRNHKMLLGRVPGGHLVHPISCLVQN